MQATWQIWKFSKISLNPHYVAINSHSCYHRALLVAHLAKFFIIYLQDIDDYHSQIVYRDPDLFASGVSDLPSSTLSYLKQLLTESPQFGRAVVNNLTSKGKGFLKNNQLLQQLYVDLINDQLKALDSEDVDADCIDPNAVSTGESPVDSVTKRCKFIYQMLSYMNPSSEIVSLSESIDDLFKSLINRTCIPKLSKLDKGMLYSCLLNQPTTYLIEKFCFIENQMRFCIEGRPELPLSRTSLQGFKQQATLVGPFVQVCYSQSFMENRKEAWKFLLFHALDENHILENIVVRLIWYYYNKFFFHHILFGSWLLYYLLHVFVCLFSDRLHMTS